MSKTDFELGHVYYFEPNDISFGKDQNKEDVPLNPHYEDMCIAMSLTADIYPRNKKYIHKISEGENNEDVIQRRISWICYNTDGAQQLVSAGAKMGDDRFLTTYYTEISADKYIENELVEGLGITSVNISFESWYTPTITINFIDVHGSALWGREEAIHDNGEITSNNIFGVFFTQPYPLFRLQIKGFLGQAVTYQLSVSSFKGNYNSQTGNFEATATFIGYSYSLLSDIPVNLLSSIAETDYVGRKYWQNNVGRQRWQLHNSDGTTSQPIPLFILIDNIRSCIGSLDSVRTKNCEGIEEDEKRSDGDGTVGSATEKDQIVPLESANIVTSATQDSGELNDIKKKMDDFIEACRLFCEDKNKGKNGVLINTGIGTINHQLLLLYDNEDILSQNKIAYAYRELYDAIKKYNTNHPDYQILNCIENKCEDFHNGALSVKTNKPFVMSKEKMFTIYNKGVKLAKNNIRYDSEYHAFVGNNHNHVNVNNHTLTYKTSNVLATHYNTFKAAAEKYDFTSVVTRKNLPNFGEYVSVILLDNMYYEVNKRLGIIEDSANNIENGVENQIASQNNATQVIRTTRDEIVEETSKYNIKKLIGIEPTIGNFVKLLMCHLETFVEMMFVCAENIYKDEQRYPADLGLTDLNETDIPNNNTNGKKVSNADKDDFVLPWPALYNPKANVNNSETRAQEKTEMMGWPLDYKPKKTNIWEEAKVVLSLMDAIAKSEELLRTKYKNGSGNAYSSIPLSGLDLTSLSSPFSNIDDTWNNIGTLSAYLGLRAAQVIGVSDNICNDEVAEAIGSMDAINLIFANANPMSLKEAVTPKDGKPSFAERVIDYITCNNNEKNICESERGVSYNIFEMSKNGSAYHKSRHPMFVSDGNYGYKYSYIYTPSTNSENVSIVPTNILKFVSSTMPYAKPMGLTNNGNLVFYPEVSLDGNQQWVYTAKTNKIKILSDNDDIINDQAFSVIEDSNQVLSLVGEIESLREGTLKVNGISFKGEKDDNKVKIFIDRKYRISDKDYLKFYFTEKNYHIVSSPYDSWNKDYVKEHLYDSAEKKDDVTFDDQWVFDTISNPHNLFTLQQDGDNFAFKNDNTTFINDEISVTNLPMMTNSKTIISLFGSFLYYLQNDITDYRLRRYAKAYLVLSSLMSGVKPETEFFNNDSQNIIKRFPPFYVLFLGALLWRRSLEEEDDINFGKYSNIAPSKNETLISKAHEILYFDTSVKINWYKTDDYINYDNTDILVKNKLIRLFKKYAEGEVFNQILNGCELIDASNPNNLINSKRWGELMGEWSSSDFDTKKVNGWVSLFGEFYQSYLSIVLPTNKQNLRLLINPNSKAAKSLDFLYGIVSPFVVGRATTKKVGNGGNEVKIKKSQLKSYLKGFEERLTRIEKEAKEEEKNTSINTSETTDRDLSVSIYYALKHVWDAWLISAARDQFTIEEFFNKYFVFIDSFYVNVYQDIKLNAEVIESSYCRKDQNLLTFIDNVTSNAGCMLFALPDFIDSNRDHKTVGEYKNDLSWKKEDLKRMFTPIPYNEMSPPAPNNTFVFVYTHPYSDNASENTGKRFDGYMMDDTEHWPKVLTQGPIGTTADRMTDNNDLNIPARPNNTLNESEDLITGRYGYMMPCFGVAVNRGNNHIFKSINVNMDSPKITSVAAQTWENILYKTGADGYKRIFFRGQDIYPIYSQYSYACEIEMMGCAQIQPLMYFQLLNIPMWRGTYMIYKVTHSMSPGQMVTKFTGMKMSRYRAPFALSYFSVGKQKSRKRDQNDTEDSSGNSMVSYNGDTSTDLKTFIQKIFGNTNEYRISGHFNDDRGDHKHEGIDIPVKEGATLYAPWDCKIVRAVPIEDDDDGGIRIHIKHKNKNVSLWYMHCSCLLEKTINKEIKAGTAIAKSGNTGSSTGPHLHFYLEINGKRVDPERDGRCKDAFV